MTDTLKLEGVGLDVRDGSSLRTLLEIDEFCLEPGEMIAVRGASGAGKTTFLKLVSGILLPTRGRVLYGDTEVSALSEPRRDRWRGRHVARPSSAPRPPTASATKSYPCTAGRPAQDTRTTTDASRSWAGCPKAARPGTAPS